MATEPQPSGRFNAARPDGRLRRWLAKEGTASSHSGDLVAAGSVMVAVAGIFVAVTALEPGGRTPKTVWANAWFDTGLAFLVVGLIIVAFGLYLSFRKQNPQPPKEAGPQSIPAVGELGVPSQGSPLLVRILPDHEFEGRGPSAMFAALHISVDNTTDRSIRVVGCEFSYNNEGRLSWEHYVNDEQRKDFQDELKRRDAMQRYGPSLQLPAWIDARSHVSGWILKSVTRNLSGGTPTCTVFIVDDLGNSYEARLAGQEPRTYPAKG